MGKTLNRWSRKVHRWGSILAITPLIVVILTGLLLQVKKEFDWIQPAATRGVSDRPVIEWKQILDVVKAEPAASVHGWGDVDRLDVRPGHGIVKVRAKNRWEVQLDLETGQVLSSQYRRSDLIESLHDGSFFGAAAKYGVFLPSGVVLLVLWGTGAYLWFLPYLSRRRSRKPVRSQGKA